jgi:hypothetical protein
MPIVPVSDAHPVPSVRKTGKLEASYRLTRQSFALLQKDKEILLFPILSTLATLAVVGVMLFGAYAILTSGSSDAVIQKLSQGEQGRIAVYAFVFVQYLIGAFIVTFFQAGLTAIVHGRLQGKDLGFRDGMRIAMDHIGKIFLWSLLSATVGLVLRIVSDRSKFVGKLVAGLLGAAWGVVTLFIVPTLILEPGTVKDAVRRSAETFRKAWGETILVHFSIGLCMMLLGLAGVAAFVLLLFTQSLSLILGGAVVLALFLVALGILSSTLETVFRVVLYEYARTGAVPDGFSPELVTGAIRKA